MSSASVLRLDASYVIAFLLVVFYAFSRFKTPKIVRSQTSRVQFWLSGGAYVASSVGVFMLLTWGIRQNSGLIQALHFGASDHADSDIANLDAALVAALMLTTLLPNFPLLRDVDSGILGFFHKMGSIPFCAQLWARQMANQYDVPSTAAASMRQYILDSTHLPDALIGELRTDPKTDQMRFRFTRNFAIYVSLSKFKGRTRFADEYPEDMAAFEKRMSSYLAQCAGFLALIAKLSPKELEKVPESVQKFRALNLEAYEDLRLMLSRVMLYSCRGETEIIQRLNEIGFSLQRAAPIVVPVNLLAFDAVAVIAMFVIATVVSHFSSPESMSLGKAILIGLLVSMNDSIAAAFALLPKQIWSFADIRSARERPYLGYIVSALIALTISLPLSYGFFVFKTNYLQNAGHIMPFAAQCKWLLLSTTLAFALAFACDDDIKRDHEPRWLRWTEAAAIAALMAIAGLFVAQWLASDRAALHNGVSTARHWMPIALNAGIGALFGATIPHWYRLTAHRVEPPARCATLVADLTMEEPEDVMGDGADRVPAPA